LRLAVNSSNGASTRALLSNLREMPGSPFNPAINYSLLFKTHNQDKQLSLPSGATLIGRASNCDLVLDDASVSRWHARFLVSDESCSVVDLGSRNGTFVNGEQIIEPQELHDGDRVALGYVTFTVRAAATAPVMLVDSAAVDDSAGIYRSMGHAPDAASHIDRRRLLQMLADIGRTLVGVQPIDEVLGGVVDLALGSTNAERVLLLLWDQNTGELVPRIVRHRAGGEPPTAISRTIVDRVMRDRVSMLAIDAQHDPRVASAASIAALHTRSFMCAPLWHAGEIIGLLYVDNPVTRRFSEADLELFTAFSNYAAVAIAQARLAARVRQEVNRRERLARYHSPAVVERLLQADADTEGEAPMIATERDVTVLIADIVGFTALAERLPTQQVAVLLNVFFSRMADVIFAHAGTLDKFIGDAVLAIFGAPLDLPNHALNAVRAAQAMHNALADLNRERGEPHLEMRIAIHSGLALVGDMGSPRRREYSVLGSVPNTVARIEDGIAGPGQIIITRATLDRLESGVTVRSIGRHTFRGQSNDVELFEIRSA
jgi:adenylate cyclase